MPKIVLKNGETGNLEEFEPVDAREILSTEGTIYSVAEGSKDEIGLDIGPGGKDINVPQLQGADVEMNTGLSIEKYGRAAVVKAQPGNVRSISEANADEVGDEKPKRKGGRPKKVKPANEPAPAE